MKFLLLLGVVCAVSATPLPSKSTNCVVSLVSLNPEPVVVSTSTKFIYPQSDNKEITISSGQTIILTCSKGHFTLSSLNNKNTFEAKCISKQQFSFGDETFDFSSLQCSNNVKHSSRSTGKSCASGNGAEIEIGFDLESNDNIIDLYNVCFDKTKYNTLYSTYNLTKKISTKETRVSRVNFMENDIFDLGTSVNTLYTRQTQRVTINKQLGLPEDSQKYVQETSNYFLARGHLTAMADFVYAPQQRATFDYVNVAPQWQTFNGGNWQTLEANIRDYAAAEELDLVVYTGTYGVATLPHAETGEETPLYLYVDENERYGIPVPELYWKVVYEPQRQEGIAFLGVNNPYQKNVKRSVICKDISEEIDWLTWKRENLTLGYSYVCDVRDLRKKISYLPDFKVVDLLL